MSAAGKSPSGGVRQKAPVTRNVTLSKVQEQKVKNIFFSLDNDSSGFIDTKELKPLIGILTNMGLTLQMKDLERIVTKFDSSRAKRLSLMDFGQLLIYLLELKNKRKVIFPTVRSSVLDFHIQRNEERSKKIAKEVAVKQQKTTAAAKPQPTPAPQTPSSPPAQEEPASFLQIFQKAQPAQEVPVAPKEVDVRLFEDDTEVLEKQKQAEALREGFKRGHIYLRDNSESDLSKMKFYDQGVACIFEVKDNIGDGIYRSAYKYKILKRDVLVEENMIFIPENLWEGVLKYYSPTSQNFMKPEHIPYLVDYDCKKQWFLLDMADAFKQKLESKFPTAIYPSFVNCAKVVFDDGTTVMIEPKLEFFERLTNNTGEGCDDLSPVMSAYSHYVFEVSGKQHLPCDFQGDSLYNVFTDPDIVSWGSKFLGIHNHGKECVTACLNPHFEGSNCTANEFCKALRLRPEYE